MMCVRLHDAEEKKIQIYLKGFIYIIRLTAFISENVNVKRPDKI